MSSRIVTREAAHTLNIRPLSWRASPLSNVPQPLDLPLDTGSELNSMVERARREGFDAGRTAGIEEGRKQIAPAAIALQAITIELSGLPTRVRAECEVATVKLALNIARRVLYRELSVAPEALLGLVKAVFQTCDTKDRCILRIAPQDYESLQTVQRNFALPSNLELRPDPTLSRGSVVFETPRGEIDASIETQLREIERGFADMFEYRR